MPAAVVRRAVGPGGWNDGRVRLVYLSPGSLDAKALDGLTEFARTWPGELAVVAPAPADGAEGVTVTVAGPGEAERAIRGLRPQVVLALHRPEYAWLSDLAPTVFTSEVTRRIRTDLQLLTARSTVDRARIVVGQARRDVAFRAMARRAAGLQCNGYAAWDAYAGLNGRALRFRDHRLRADDLAAARERRFWDGDRRLRVAFSGRITTVKGVATVLEVAERLPEVDFEILGDGDDRARLAAQAPPNVAFRGFLPFAQWKAHVRDHVDVALLPHPQGDPSCTYYEFLGSGVPVVGLRNTTWTRLAHEEQLGWAEPDAAGLAARIAALRPADLVAVAERAREVVEPFEVVAARRVDHLVSVARNA